MGMARTQTREIEPYIIVKGGDVLQQVWPEETRELDALEDRYTATAPLHHLERLAS
jgi:hypothetical protein